MLFMTRDDRSGMATGRSNKLVGATGEYLVAAELSRRGLIATTFTGNVPHYDIIAANELGKHVLVQVKAGRASSWQLALGQFCEVTFERKKQILGRKNRCPISGLIVVFVRIDPDRMDRFYICTWEQLRDAILKSHADFLSRNNGRRPKVWDSMHSAIKESQIAAYRDNWSLITESLR